MNDYDLNIAKKYFLNYDKISDKIKKDNIIFTEFQLKITQYDYKSTQFILYYSLLYYEIFNNNINYNILDLSLQNSLLESILFSYYSLNKINYNIYKLQLYFNNKDKKDLLKNIKRNIDNILLIYPDLNNYKIDDEFIN